MDTGYNELSFAQKIKKRQGKFLRKSEWVERLLLQKNRFLFQRRALKMHGKEFQYQQEIEFVKQYGYHTPFPYLFSKEYEAINVVCKCDSEKRLRYVQVDNKRLYFPRNYSQRKIVEYFRLALCEQDERNPHKYRTKEFSPNRESLFFDVGCAEAYESLMLIDQVKEVHLFECETEWIEALHATFEPYQEKVFINEMTVSDQVGPQTTTIDEYVMKEFGESVEGTSFFIKIDVEGAELQVLNGAKNTLKNHPCMVACCTYHRANHADAISCFFKKLLSKESPYQVSFSEGYLLMMMDVTAYPLFRKGVLRAQRDT